MESINLINMESYSNINIIDVLNHTNDSLNNTIKALNDTIKRLNNTIKLKDTLLDSYMKLTTELEEEIEKLQTDTPTPKRKSLPVRTIIRWEPGWKVKGDYYSRNRASGVVTKNGFLEFLRHVDGTTNYRTYFKSVEDWMESIPSQTNEEFKCE